MKSQIILDDNKYIKTQQDLDDLEEAIQVIDDIPTVNYVYTKKLALRVSVGNHRSVEEKHLEDFINDYIQYSNVEPVFDDEGHKSYVAMVDIPYLAQLLDVEIETKLNP